MEKVNNKNFQLHDLVFCSINGLGIIKYTHNGLYPLFIIFKNLFATYTANGEILMYSTSTLKKLNINEETIVFSKNLGEGKGTLIRNEENNRYLFNVFFFESGKEIKYTLSDEQINCY